MFLLKFLTVDCRTLLSCKIYARFEIIVEIWHSTGDMFHTRGEKNSWSWNHIFWLAYISSQISFNKTGFSCLTSCFELYYPTSGSNSGFNPTARAESQPLLLLHGLKGCQRKAACHKQISIHLSTSCSLKIYCQNDFSWTFSLKCRHAIRLPPRPSFKMPLPYLSDQQQMRS